MLRRSILLVAISFLCLAAPASLITQYVAPSGTFSVMSISLSGRNWTSTPSADLSSYEDDDNMVYIGVRLSELDYGVVNIQEGFSFMRVRIDEGVYVDMINLQANSGIGLVNQVEKCWNIQQIVDFINANSIGNAVIVFGNTNSLYTSPEDNIRLLTTQNGLTDAWVQAIGGNAPAVGADEMVCPSGIPSSISCEGVDKVFYRGSPIINLNSSGFFYDTSRFLSSKGIPLADRNPIRVEFEYTLKSGLRQSDLCGGPHGTWFNDLDSIPSSPRLSSITLRGGNRLDGLTLTLTSGQAFAHGGWGGDSYSLTLAQGEYITAVKLCWGKRHGHTRNFYAEATTNIGRGVQAGKMTDNCANVAAPSGYGVIGTYGRAGDEMDQLGFIYNEQPPQITRAVG
ncbi:unnamed protein product [Rhizoctonia solani]|uniref:Jacalin-type lectin domain-containing protein n=1 Tax=Rhizoctonia solani TaxID=456999 RepID=A0A8H3GFH1_9AGAM|nr:unnamed protein product [Rhizoctonia solani]